MDAPAFLLRAEPAPLAEGELTQLESLVKTFQEVNTEVKQDEDVLAEAKQRQLTLSREAIPAVMNQHGFSELKLRNGIKVIVEEEASVTVPDEKKMQFFAFLKERDEEDIIKLHIQFGKMPAEKQHELIDFLNNYEYDYEMEKGVHPSTLKSYVKKLLGVGEEKEVVERGIQTGRFLRKQDVDGIMDVYTFYKTKLKA